LEQNWKMAFYSQKYIKGMEKDKLKEKLIYIYNQTAVNKVKENEKYTNINRFNRIIIN
jgi:hypothetical protein